MPDQASAVAALELRGVVKDFSVGLRGLRLRAVDHLDLTVQAGQVYGLLGPNGSGKSTTIKIILGLLAPGAGESRIFGVPSGSVAARRDVGYLPESPYFYRHLSGRELVRFYGRMCGLGGPSLEARIADLLHTVGLSEAGDRRVGTYSKGMLQRIGLAQALVHDPRLLILDEPTAGVDPVGSAAITELILGLKARGKTVLITSHLLGQIEDICDRVAILDCDAHYGDGTDAIIETLGIDWVEHHTQGSQFGMETDAANGAYERWLETAIDKCSGCSVVLYQAGADPHIDDPLGGILTTQQMSARDQRVFERLGHLPMVWNLAGGYQVVAGKTAAERIEPVLALHRETARLHIEKFG